MLVYCSWTFVAFALLTFGKYGKRQSQLERQYQGRMAAAEKQTGEQLSPPAQLPIAAAVEQTAQSPSESESTAVNKTQYSSPENTAIPLWPLTIIFFSLATLGSVMLWRERRDLTASGDPLDQLSAHNSPP